MPKPQMKIQNSVSMQVLGANQPELGTGNDWVSLTFKGPGLKPNATPDDLIAMLERGIAQLRNVNMIYPND